MLTLQIFSVCSVRTGPGAVTFNFPTADLNKS